MYLSFIVGVHELSKWYFTADGSGPVLFGPFAGLSWCLFRIIKFKSPDKSTFLQECKQAFIYVVP
jgi:hypothetical protein